jgi:S-adenosylmethionine:tRNA ribosyltransferase-isomerase
VHSEDFRFDLPRERIAQRPAEPRDSARLMVVSRSRPGEVHHAIVRDLPTFLRADDLLVVNDTRVVPARLVGRRATGGRVEALVVERDGADCVGFLRPGRKAHPDDRWEMEGGALVLVPGAPLGDGRFAFRLELPPGGGEAMGTPDPIGAVLRACGRAPLPPYVDRDDAEDPDFDRTRYQTVYARADGSIAAPTAGLHFTDALLQEIERVGVKRATVTLHVGLGTFVPLTPGPVAEHRMQEEVYELSSETEAAVVSCRRAGGRVIAVGTTSTRTLETCAVDGEGGVVARAGSGATGVFLHPDSPPRLVDGLMTNFHLPGSTPIVLVAAFLGRERTLDLYAEAIRREYRFFSYGDAMLILP